MIKYERLFDLLENEKISQYQLVKRDHVIGGNTYDQLRDGKSVTTDTLNKLCNYLQCDISDIIEYIPDDTLN